MQEITLVPFADGRFEVLVDGKKIYSKLETGSFPDEDALVREVASVR